MDGLNSRHIHEKYGEPDWVGFYQNPIAVKTQWFYHLGAGKIRYVFFVDDIFQWDMIITEDKMLRVIYDNHRFTE